MMLYDGLVISNQLMQQIEDSTLAAGATISGLMQKAGAAVSEVILARFPRAKTLVVCGPGKNGGDGLSAAAFLREQGWEVDVFTQTDAHPSIEDRYEVIIDAVFGTGLSRGVEGNLATLFAEINRSKAAIVSVDIPSGVNGDTGQIMGCAINADITVTFQATKIGHLLYPGRSFAGELVLADIGLDLGTALNKENVRINHPRVWKSHIPQLRHDSHKYSRGHMLVAGGEMAGAAMLAASAGQRSTAGLVTLAFPAAHAHEYVRAPLSAIKHVIESYEMATHKVNAVVIGPGLGISAYSKSLVLSMLQNDISCVLDADALTAFADDPSVLFSLIKPGKTVITPHAGEFRRLFDNGGDKLSATLAAARKSGSVVVNKGADTVIAAPDGRALINNNAPFSLSVGGSGDVLAGTIGSFLASGMAPFEAAAAGVWVNGRAAQNLGKYFIAEDIIGALPTIIGAI